VASTMGISINKLWGGFFRLSTGFRGVSVYYCEPPVMVVWVTFERQLGRLL